MLLLKSNQDGTVCYICRKRFIKRVLADKKPLDKLGTNLRFNVPIEFSAVFHGRPNYDYHLIIKELANESEGQVEFIGKNTGKYETFSVPKEKLI